MLARKISEGARVQAFVRGVALTLVFAALAAAQQAGTFRGGLQSYEETAPAPAPVRNDTARESDEIVTLRYFKIKKGAFPEFYRASVEGVWPYFEKIGARVVGMWQIVHPAVDGSATSEESPEYDEVYLMTRYASVEHWRATRETYKHGGNGPDWSKCMAAINLRRELTIETSLQFLKGHKWDNAPWFMPGLDETYTRE